MFLKYLFVPALALTFMACQADQGDPMAQQEGQDAPPMDQQFQPGQSAEIDVSDDELRQFVEVSSVAQEVQMEGQMEMVAIVEDEGLDVQTYNQIAEARYMGHSDDELEVSSEQIERYEAAYEKVSEIEVELEQKMADAINEEGMDMDRFMELNMALQQDPALQQRVQQMMMDEQAEEGEFEMEGY